MTTVAAALALDGSVVFISDTHGWMNDRPTPGMRKAWAHPVGDGSGRSVLVGNAGMSVVKDLARAHWKLDAVPNDDCTDEEADAWAAACAEALADIAVSARPAPTDRDGYVESEALLSYGGRLWSLSQQCAAPLYRARHFYACGSGGEIALGALHALLPRAPGSAGEAEFALHKAMHAACVWNAWTGVDDDGPTVLRLTKAGQLA